MGTCHLPLWALNHVLLQLLTFNAPWNEFRVREQKWGALCSGKNWQNRFSDSQLFQESTLWAQFLYLPIYKKHWNPSGWQLFLVTARKLLPKKKKKIAWLHVFPFTKITNILTFPIKSLEQFLRATWVLSCGDCHLILPKIKLNSRFSHCAFFKNLALISLLGGRPWWLRW